jgi:glutathione peroxidase
MALPKAARTSTYQHIFSSIDGIPLPLAAYQGKVLLLVNTASQCGFTRQYAGLQKLYETHADRGLVVIGLPCNDFGKQEPACTADIQQFTQTRFNITFPLSDKITTKGVGAHPFFAQVKKEFGFFALPHWNFYKYIIGRDGKIITWYTPLTHPSSRKLIRAVESALANQSA